MHHVSYMVDTWDVIGPIAHTQMLCVRSVGCGSTAIISNVRGASTAIIGSVGGASTAIISGVGCGSTAIRSGAGGGSTAIISSVGCGSTVIWRTNGPCVFERLPMRLQVLLIQFSSALW